MERLDLLRHDVEEIPGKFVSINGADYRFENLMSEGGEAWVFPLRNVTSGVVQWVAKLYKFGPDSPEMRKIRDDLDHDLPPTPSFQGRARGLDFLTHDEIYDLGGGVFRFQRLIGTVPGLHAVQERERMARVARSYEEGRFDDAIAILDEILAANPNDTMALENRARCLARRGLDPGALVPLRRAIEIEPNDTRLTHLWVSFCDHLGLLERALSELERTLQRWKWDYDSWKVLIELALKWDMGEIAETQIAELERVAPDSAFISGYRAQLADSRRRRATFDRALDAAIERQMANDFAGALAYCEEAANASKRNQAAVLNLAVCHYHLRHFREALAAAGNLLGWDLGTMRRPAVMLALLAAYHSGNTAGALHLTGYIDTSSAHPADLPGVPVAILPDEFFEQLSARPIMEVLLALPRPAEHRDKIERLIDLYSQYDIAMGV